MTMVESYTEQTLRTIIGLETSIREVRKFPPLQKMIKNIGFQYYLDLKRNRLQEEANKILEINGIKQVRTDKQKEFLMEFDKKYELSPRETPAY